ncbi:unnamed protein product [Periconia digitata]|uniref:Uncharacterized protein n=1 Tax=Periconia digitata TaxID=1303443 RepID=A0A9W4U8U3_9PLEO|nr:unnamed protein product [Periconia digitata]
MFAKTLSASHQHGKRLSEPRIRQLGSLVTWLCLSFCSERLEICDFWNPFRNFVNLEHLELFADWGRPRKLVPFSAPEYGLTQLRTLKLRGYLPMEFVQWLLNEPAHVEELQLCVLDFPGIHCGGHGEPEQFFEAIPPHMRDQVVMDAIEDRRRLRGLARFADYQDKAIAPRSLACLSFDTIRRFKKLNKLYLYKPAAGRDHDDLEVYFSVSSEFRILLEWRDLILATRNTLEYIIFDQRPVCDLRESDDQAEIVCEVSHGDSYKRFVDIVLPTLIQGETFPALRMIRLFGFEPYEDDPCKEGPQEFELLGESENVPALLQAAFPEAKITNHIGRPIFIHKKWGELYGGGDVLNDTAGLLTIGEMIMY